MKKSHVHFIAVIVFGALCVAFPLLADDTVDSLMAGPWKVVGISWTRTRIFYENGTFTTREEMKEHGKWSIHDGVVELDFAEGHADFFTLPLITKGTPGKDAHDTPLVAYLQGPPPAGNPGAPSAPRGPLAGDFSAKDTTAVLTAGPWKVWADGWSTQWTFRTNGMFFSDSGQHGKWQFNGNAVEVTLDDGHKQSLWLPLKPTTVAGTDANGLTLVGFLANYDSVKDSLPGAPAPVAAATSKPVVATPSRPPMAVATPVKNVAPAAGAPTPMPIPTQTLPGDNIGVLTAGPWKVQGAGFNAEFGFNKDGSVHWQGGDKGKWHVEGNSVVVEFAAEPIVISLPLNARGTLASRGGRGGIAVMITANNFVQDAHNSPHLNTGNVPANIPETDTIAWLTSQPWRCSGVNWYGDKTFKADGTFMSFEKKRQTGTWKIVQGNVELTFDGGSKETLLGPLDPRGTIGLDADGLAMFDIQLGQKLVANLPAQRPYPPAPASSVLAQPAHPIAPAPGGQGNNSILGALAGFVREVVPRPQPTPVPLPPEMQQKAADLVKAYNRSIVFVTGKDAAGSGFIASIQGKNFLVTNAHVAAGVHNAAFKDMNDTAIQGGQGSVAVGRDLYCMALAAGGQPLPLMDAVGENAAIGDEVVVLGNAEGEGVVNLITGRITGIGPDRVEVDAPFVPGNSGSPIIHIKSGKVIGVATYMSVKYFDPATGDMLPRPIVRRFGYRLDNVKQWQPVDPKVFAAQAAEMESVETLTEDLYGVCEALADGMDGVTPEDFTTPGVRNCIDQWLRANKGPHSVQERKQSVSDLLTTLKNLAEADVTAARLRMTYDYFKSELAEQQGYRDDFAKAFDAATRAMDN